MVDTRQLRGRRVVVWGLGRFGGGVGAAHWLCRQGAAVTIVDRAPATELDESVEFLRGLPIRFELGGEDRVHFESADLVVINPAIPKRRSETYAWLAAQGIPWTTEINLFLERCPCPIAAVTGSFGKSTAATLLATALRAARDGPVHLGGNLGGSLLPDLERMTPADVVVLELSDAQLCDVPRIARRPDFAIITNVVPHHLDRHGSFETYARVKCNVFRGPRPARAVVVGPVTVPADRIILSELSSCGCERLDAAPPQPPLALSLIGEHNETLAAQVWSLLRHLRYDGDAARSALEAFSGLPHRLERLSSVGGVSFINDSKSTSPACTLAAIEATPGPLIAIVGGSSAGEPLDDAAGTLARRCRAVVAVGASRRAWLEAARTAGVAAVFAAADVPEAVRLAIGAARPGDTVLFSPGGPSFDQFPNFERRGAAFREAVAAIVGDRLISRR
ncbi:MAG: UDP-N-acetylmuramoyl-L-alanine--D-glutamate ligase [Phycisphaerales bacterium]|nr:MAG: UDP-N-acetylmuramoyl-L-alanine--D-glutamate ligase [Phycisphaerales bacterium]